MCHGIGQDGSMINLTKASNVLCALLVLHGVCKYGVGGCLFHEATENTRANGKVHIPEPQPRNHLSPALHFTWFNVAAC